MQTITHELTYKDNLQAFYAQRCDTLNTLLLESSSQEIHKSRLSLLGISCAVKILCRGATVTAEALSDNGAALLARVAERARGREHAGRFTCTADERKLELTYVRHDGGLDERSRLQQHGQLHCLQLFCSELTACPDILFAGVISFDYINNFEHVHDIEPWQYDFADYIFYLFDMVITQDHREHTARIDGHVFNADAQAMHRRMAMLAERYEECTASFECGDTAAVEPEAEPDLSDERFCEMVEQLKEHIRQGDVFQVVPSRTFAIECRDPQLSYAYLKKHNASPYMFFLHDPMFVLFGASPEFALRVDMASREVAISPIAGTKPRGTTARGRIDPDLDSRIELELRTDRKEIAEHLMLVDLARNDLARISRTGSVRVENMLHVDKYQSVQHLVTDVRGTLDEGFDAFSAYLACMNMGTLSGAPKIMAHRLIYRYEGRKRGAYGGVVARLSPDGSLDSCIVIRSAIVHGGRALVQAGCGVVAYSAPTSEAQETRHKARAVLLAITRANRSG